MSKPLVTVLMPVYNAGGFLKEAIQSVLTQTFVDFELLLINDGSTDNSGEIIAGFYDPRIRSITNHKNAGLIATLNRGIDIAQSEFIARMDSDDVCLPQRLEQQVAYLQAHKAVSFVATTTKIIDENGRDSGVWELDREIVTAKDIRKTMPWKNCITHPSVMGRTVAFKHFKYKTYQRHVEDYDLWLRVLNSGGVIAKIAEPLLLYRQHSSSVTNTKLKQSFALKHYRMKKRFLTHEFRQTGLTLFALTVLSSMSVDGVTALYKMLKRKTGA